MNYYNLKPKDRVEVAVKLLNDGLLRQEVAGKMGLTLGQVKYCFKLHTKQGKKLRLISLGKIKSMINIFKDEPGCSFTAYQIAQILNLRVSTVQSQLHSLYKNGDIKRVFQGHYQWAGE